MKKILSAFIFVLISFFTVAAQNPAPTATPTPKPVDKDDDVVKISTNLIQLDVTVTDNKGKIVTDLKPEDFEIYENEEKQSITNFSYIDTTPATKPAPTPKPDKNIIGAPIPPVQLRPEQVRRTIALVVDDLGLSFESTHFVRRALKKFVDEQMQPNDFVAIIRTGSGIGALQQFTSDKNLLYAAIEKITWNPLGRAGISAFAPIEQDPVEEEEETTSDDGIGTRDSNKEFNEFREDIFSVGTLGAVNFVVKGMQELPGKKSIMLFSDGFVICTAENPDRCLRFRDSLRELVDLSNRASVTIYAQDARGLQYTGLTAADKVNGNQQSIQTAISSRAAELYDKQEGLAYLARETGGKAVFNSNNLNLGLEKLLEDTKGYYLLGYQPDSDTFDAASRRFNKLSVKVKRPGMTVSYRSGFFGVADADIKRPAASAQTPVQQIQRALSSPFSANGINLKLNTLLGKDVKNGTFVNSLLHVQAKDLKFTAAPDGTKKAVFDVLAINFGENGTVVDQISKNYTLTAKNEETYQNILKNGFVYHFLFPIKKPGAYQMRVAIRDSTSSLVGSANQFIEVPDLKKGRLTLSGIVLENLNEKQWAELQNGSAASPQQRGADPMLDTSLRRFKRGSILRYGVEVYNAKLDQSNKPNLSTQVRVFREGKLLMDGTAKPLDISGQTDFSKVNFLGAMSLGEKMQPGDYVLQIIVLDNSAKSSRKLANRWIQFEIVE